MKFNKLAEKAKQAIDRRGGMDSLKEDLQEVKDAATGRGSFKDKARAAADALKTPGRNPAAGPEAARPVPGPEAARPVPGPEAARPAPPPAAAPTDPTPPAA